MIEKEREPHSWGILLLCAALVVYSGFFAYLARYSSPSGDDYWFFRSLELYGYIDSQIAYWFGWGGRFVKVFVIQSSLSLGAMENYFWHPVLAMCFNFLSLLFLTSILFPKIKNSYNIFLSLLLLAAWISVAYELQQTLYWLCGFFYYWGSGVFLIELALIVRICRGEVSKKVFFLLALIVFLNSGVSELSASYQLPMFLAASFVSANGKTRGFIVIFCVAVFGFALQLMNPGNAVRVLEIGNIDINLAEAPQNISAAIKIALEYGLISSVMFFLRQPIIYTIFLFIPFFSKNIPQPEFVSKLPFKIKLWHIFAFEAVTFACFQAIGGYSMGNFLYPRAMALMFWFGYFQWVLFFAFLYRNGRLSERIKELRVFRLRAVIFVLLLFMNQNFFSLIHDYRIVPQYTAQFYSRRAYMAEQRRAGNADIVLPSISPEPILFMRDHFNDSEKFPSESIYHGFKSIREVYGPLSDAARKGEENEIRALRELVLAGDAEAQFILGLYFDPTEPEFKSRYINKNIDSAVQLYIVASESGHEAAKNALWMLYNGGFHTIYDWQIIKWAVLSTIMPF